MSAEKLQLKIGRLVCSLCIETIKYWKYWKV